MLLSLVDTGGGEGIANNGFLFQGGPVKLSGNTILITGGTSGIGLELASQLLKRGNEVIVTGRDQAKLGEVKKQLPGAHTIQSDVSDAGAIDGLYARVIKDFPDLNVLVNNAGIMRKINLQDDDRDIAGLTREIDIN